MRRLLGPVLLVLVLTGCGAGEGSPDPAPPGSGSPAPSGAATPMPAAVTPHDDGAVFLLEVGGTSTLRIVEAGAEPSVTGESVQLIPNLSVAPGGTPEWEVRAVAPGTSTVRGTDPPFAFTVRVGPAGQSATSTCTWSRCSSTRATALLLPAVLTE